MDPPPGLYVAAVGSATDGGDELRPCPAGTGPNARLDGCEACPPGLYATEGSGCRPCADGTYSAAANSTACAACPPVPLLLLRLRLLLFLLTM